MNANNGLMGLVRAGLVNRWISPEGGNIFQLTDAGRIMVESLSQPATP